MEKFNTIFLLLLSLCFSTQLSAESIDSAAMTEAQPMLITCSEGSYEMYETEIIEADSLFRYSFNLYLNTWDEKKPSVYKSARYPGTGTVKLALFPDSGAYSMPCDNNLVTSRYGWRRGRMHRGTDVDLVTGDEVRTVMDGVVRFAGWHSGYGNCVLVRHMNGLETLYAHLSKLSVEPGELIGHGELIGLGGTTGHSTGSHLHFEVHFMGRAINPELIFDFKNKTAITNYLLISSDGKAKAWSADEDLEVSDAQKTEPLTEDHDAETELASTSTEDMSSSAAKYHYIKKGETLYRLSKKYKTTIPKLCKLNGLRSNSTLKIGQKIRVK